MTLASAVTPVADPEVASKIQSVINDLDATVKEIRSTIFPLHFDEQPTP
jgi:hypothetical protein